jgi:broad specificity phosphatase PhoE
MRLEPDNTMTCREAQLLMSLYIKDDPGLMQEQRQAIETHLLICSACAEEYEEDRQLVAMLRQYWPISRNTRKLLQDGLYEAEKREDRCTCGKTYRPMTVEEGWEDLKRRCPSLVEDCRRHERKKKLRKLVWRIGVIAAAAWSPLAAAG